MIPIYICEDDSIQLRKIETIIEKYLFIEAYDMEIVCACTNPQKILDVLRPDMPVGIYFFDIDLNADIVGLKLAEKIRQYDTLGYIIFITSFSDAWRMTFEYKVSALDFIDKACGDELPAKITASLQAAWSQYQKSSSYVKKSIPLRNNGTILYKDIDAVLYIKSIASHRIQVQLNNGYSEANGDLNDLEKILPDCFFRCHRSYIINLKNVSCFQERENIVNLGNEAFCPVSFRKKCELKRKLLK